MSNGWTGGQYSLFRAVFGGYLLIHYAQLVPWGRELFSREGAVPEASLSPLYGLFPNLLAWIDAPAAVTLLLVAAVGLAALFAVGWCDRAAALGLWYVGACLLGRNPLIANPSLPYVGWLLLAHAFLPAAPFGSWAARDRTDPDGGWRLPRRIFGLAWLVMAAGYSYSGYTKLVSPSWIDGSALARVLDNPLARPGPVRELMLALPDGLLRLITWASLGLELLFLPLAFSRKVRPWLWGSMLGMHLALMFVIDFVDLSFGMVVLHLFTFDPAWIPARPAAPGDLLFYDGSCGLCHRMVRLVLAEDRGSTLRIAPLGGEAFTRRVGKERRGRLPDSIVVGTSDGRLLTRSAAVLFLLRRLGGAWRVVGAVGRVIPGFVLDRAYDLVAAMRYRLFRRPEEACPVLPAHLRERFDP